MLLKLKEAEKARTYDLKKHYSKVFEQLTLTLMYNLQDLSNEQLYKIHNLYNNDQIRNLNERVYLGIKNFMRDTRLDYTQELIVYYAEKHSDRKPSAIEKYK